jgi:hypothetical protein
MAPGMMSAFTAHYGRPHARLCMIAALVLLYLYPANCMTTQFRGLAEPEGVKDATVNVLNDTAFEVKGLTFSGAAPSVYWWGAKVIPGQLTCLLTMNLNYQSILCLRLGVIPVYFSP